MFVTFGWLLGCFFVCAVVFFFVLFVCLFYYVMNNLQDFVAFKAYSIRWVLTVKSREKKKLTEDLPLIQRPQTR